MDENLKRCRERFADLLRAAYSKDPIDRKLAKSAAECGAYLLSEIGRLTDVDGQSENSK